MTPIVTSEMRPFQLAQFGRAAAAVSMLLASLTGCGFGLLVAADRQPPAAQKKIATQAPVLPQYKAGSWFAFDDGSRDEVIMAAGETVIWENEKSKWEMRYRNPALPRLRWTRGSAVVLADPTSLWPLRPGETVRFNELRETRRKNGELAKSRRIWRCQVAEPTSTRTEAGSFETYPINCERLSRSRSEKRLRTRTFYYAPTIGHYVQYRTTNRQGVTTSRKLVRYHLPPSTSSR
jgi:hypothetical protein